MSDESGSVSAPFDRVPPEGVPSSEVRRLEQSLAAIADQLARVSAEVSRLAVASSQPPAHTEATPWVDAAAGMTPPPAPASREALPPSQAGARVPSPPIAGGAPFPADAPFRAGAPLPAGAALPPGVAATTAEPQRTWADTSGLKVLGWVGGGITVLGIVMLLVVAIQHGLLSPAARVLVGVVVGLVLLGGAGLLRRKESQTALAVTIACTGLAVLYLATVGAVRLANLAPPVVGHGASAVIVVIGVCLALAWREPWLAGVSFAAGAVLAPIVGDGFGPGVFVFEALLLAGGAACLLLRLGLAAWACASTAVGFVTLVGMAEGEVLPAQLLVVLFMVLLTWALFLSRWVAGSAPADPGPFPLRTRSYDPAQIARDYADFHAHAAAVAAARRDVTAATLSLAISAAVLVVALGVARPVGVYEVGIGIIAGLCGVLFACLAWAAAHIPSLAHLSLRVTAWSAAIACAAVALLRLLDGDARSISWLVLGIIVLAAVGMERLMFLLAPALAVAGFAVLAAWPALSPAALFRWPAEGLLSDTGQLLRRGWTVVLPAGICVLVLCLAAGWAVARCSAARLAEVRSTLRSDAAAGLSHGYPADEVAAARALHTTMVGWALVICSAVACYGLIAITMVLAYAVSPTRVGYQAGQIIVTVFVTLVALALLGQGFRRVVLRIGGLGIAAVAVAKLLLFDTRTLEALPRAMTTIGVGVLLLLAAVAYVVALSRMNGTAADSRPGPAGVPVEGDPPGGATGAAAAFPDAGSRWAAPPSQ